MWMISIMTTIVVICRFRDATPHGVVETNLRGHPLPTEMEPQTRFADRQSSISFARRVFIRIWSANADLLMSLPRLRHPLQASLLFLFARHSKSKLFLCSRSFVKSNRRGMVPLPVLCVGKFVSAVGVVKSY